MHCVFFPSKGERFSVSTHYPASMVYLVRFILTNVIGHNGVLTICVSLLLTPSSLRAAAAGDISGRITDPQGSAVPNAKVKLISLADSSVREATSDEQGYFEFRLVKLENYHLAAQAPGFALVSKESSLASARLTVDLQFAEVASQKQQITVVAKAPEVLSPDPSQRIIVHDDVLDANPGRPGAPVSIPGLPIETASGGIKAPQYFAPGVAGDHGEPIAQFYQLGDFLYPNNLPANAHGNGYSDPNFLISKGIGTVQADGGAFNVREGNHAVNLAVAYGPGSGWSHFSSSQATIVISTS